ncbi:hypothetical protein SARC_09478 [Sphaeroforma arctica JP610]|uniref:Uncharacterized protein n=1 Tax=Sphaeroforma arctica JP610 TaxID=667725 RepID=A0A0L0FMV6_9EUKA|nr:hypothetical protein SARC_09478 [Sphaeroforma arctica JP610]KNC78077.1 hypothetical protein SARC_09478 [Sphaeroforma arctica JP610]|eukprot:XP_014151979.1 hypothetical protein SARC_09478 [Sphaeroforma arctica JP610]
MNAQLRFEWFLELHARETQLGRRRSITDGQVAGIPLDGAIIGRTSDLQPMENQPQSVGKGLSAKLLPEQGASWTHLLRNSLPQQVGPDTGNNAGTRSLATGQTVSEGSNHHARLETCNLAAAHPVECFRPSYLGHGRRSVPRPHSQRTGIRIPTNMPVRSRAIQPNRQHANVNVNVESNFPRQQLAC